MSQPAVCEDPQIVEAWIGFEPTYDGFATRRCSPSAPVRVAFERRCWAGLSRTWAPLGGLLLLALRGVPPGQRRCITRSSEAAQRACDQRRVANFREMRGRMRDVDAQRAHEQTCECEACLIAFDARLAASPLECLDKLDLDAEGPTIDGDLVHVTSRLPSGRIFVDVHAGVRPPRDVPPREPIPVPFRPREKRSGRFTFDGNFERPCVCGHIFGVHTAAAPHECMNGDTGAGGSGEPCDCTKFKPRPRIETSWACAKCKRTKVTIGSVPIPGSEGCVHEWRRVGLVEESVRPPSYGHADPNACPHRELYAAVVDGALACLGCGCAFTIARVKP